MSLKGSRGGAECAEKEVPHLLRASASPREFKHLSGA